MKKIMAVFLFLFALFARAQAEDMPLFADITGYMRYGETVDVTLNAGTKDGVTVGMEGAVVEGSEEIGKVTVQSVSDNTCKATLKMFSPARTMSSGYRVKFMVMKAVKTEPQKETETPAPSLPAVTSQPVPDASQEIKTLAGENEKLKSDMETLKKSQEEVKQQIDKIHEQAKVKQKEKEPEDEENKRVKISGEVITKGAYDDEGEVTGFYVNPFTNLTFSGNLPKQTGWLLELNIDSIVHQAYVAPVFGSKNGESFTTLKLGKFHVPFGLGERGVDDDLKNVVDENWLVVSRMGLDVHAMGLGLDIHSKEFNASLSVINPREIDENLNVDEVVGSKEKDFVGRVEFGNKTYGIGSSFATYHISESETLRNIGVHGFWSNEKSSLKAEYVSSRYEVDDTPFSLKWNYVYVNTVLGVSKKGTKLTATWRSVKEKSDFVDDFKHEQFSAGLLFVVTPEMHIAIENKSYKEEESPSVNAWVMTFSYAF